MWNNNVKNIKNSGDKHYINFTKVWKLVFSHVPWNLFFILSYIIEVYKVFGGYTICMKEAIEKKDDSS